MKNSKIAIDLAEIPEIIDLAEREDIEIEEVVKRALGNYIDEMDESKVDKWTQVLMEIEKTDPVTLKEIGYLAFDLYLMGNFNEEDAEFWIDILTMLADIHRKEE